MQMDSGENIDHILDNMFVQRAPHFPPITGLAAAARKSASPAPVDETNETATFEKGADTDQQQKGKSFGDLDISVAVGVVPTNQTACDQN